MDASEYEFEWAVYRGDVQTVRRGLQAGWDFNHRFKGFPGNGTALHEASWNGNTEIVKLLLQHDADVNATDLHGGTALHSASRDALHFSRVSVNGKTETVKLLLQHDADVEARDNDGGTALHVASLAGYTKIVELLLQHDAGVEARDNDGRTSLHVASRYGKAKTVKLLLQHNADVEARDNDGWTALHLACKYQETEVVKLLIQHGADIEVKNKDGEKPLDYIYDKDVRRFLSNLAAEVSYHKLMKQSGGVKVDRFKLCICGPQEAGKSTLKESLQTGHVTAFFRDRMTPDHRPHERTPGVNVGTTNIPGVGEVSVWDFAGQSEYAVTHSMFMDAENTVFIVMYNIMAEIETQKREVHWWLCFIKSCNTKSTPSVILVASHADQTDTGKRVQRLPEQA
ncbi:putative ankyrin repeat protein RF_0381 [Branchiostoma floridae]|uniref:Ankyrin repeat protein RF_0381 n=1 Tax=Branchiostoma floridae TaxID=7739 RepID=A0A9J7HHS4_BRAFL|nr:putative ankyrin repeat protein RF_0381 [Branchiostoma floridae]